MSFRGIKESAPDHKAVTGRTKNISLFNKCLLRSYYVPDTVLSTGKIMQNRESKSSVYKKTFLFLVMVVGKTENNQST